MVERHYENLFALVQAALISPGLLAPNEFKLARYSLNEVSRNRLLDPDILALEDYLIDYSGLPNLPNADADKGLLQDFGDVVGFICHDEAMPLNIGYQRMAWLLDWLNAHHPPSFFGQDPDSPLQVLQMAGALGVGEWAAAYTHIEDGLAELVELANSGLWRVQEAGALGLQRLWRRDWPRTLRRLRYQILMTNAAEWRMMLMSWRLAPPEWLAAENVQILDVFEVTQAALRYLWGLDERRYSENSVIELTEELGLLLPVIVAASPELGFAHLRQWALWPSPTVKAILRAGLVALYEDGRWPIEVASVAGYLAES